MDAQTLGRASGVLHRQRKLNILNTKKNISTLKKCLLQAHWEEGGRCRGSPRKHLHHPLQHPHLQAHQDGQQVENNINFKCIKHVQKGESEVISEPGWPPRLCLRACEAVREHPQLQQEERCSHCLRHRRRLPRS